MSPHFVFHRRMDSHDGEECEECKEGREVVEMKLEVERGTSTDLSAQKKYKYDEPEAGGARNFLLGGAINEAAADHDGEEYKEGEEEVDVVKTAAILLDMAAGVVQFNNSSKCHSPTSHDAVDVGRDQEDAIAYHPNNARAELYPVEDSVAEVANEAHLRSTLLLSKGKCQRGSASLGRVPEEVVTERQVSLAQAINSYLLPKEMPLPIFKPLFQPHQ